MTIDELRKRAEQLRAAAKTNNDTQEQCQNSVLLFAMADLFQHLADWQQRIEGVKLPPVFAKMMGM